MISTLEQPCESSAKGASVATDCVDAVNLRIGSERFQDGGWMVPSWFMDLFVSLFIDLYLYKDLELGCFVMFLFKMGLAICDTRI